MSKAGDYRLGEVVAGRYNLLEVLGEGAMGTVLKAQNLDLDEPVALKFLSRALLRSQRVMARFRREARLMFHLRSENLVRVLDVGLHEQYGPYLVMEYLEGETVAARFEREHQLAPREAITFLLQAARGVAVAHAHGVVHRDLKPDNLFLARRKDSGERLKVLDFGVAKAFDADAGLTEANVTLGTPWFMAPEQFGAARDVGARSDVWSLGAVLYRALAGFLPFDANDLPALMLKLRTERPAPLVGKVPGVTSGLAAVVERCLQVEPEDRYKDAGELAHALEALIRMSTDDAIAWMERTEVDSGVLGRSSEDSPRDPFPTALDMDLANEVLRTAGPVPTKRLIPTEYTSALPNLRKGAPAPPPPPRRSAAPPAPTPPPRRGTAPPPPRGHVIERTQPLLIAEPVPATLPSAQPPPVKAIRPSPAFPETSSKSKGAPRPSDVPPRPAARHSDPPPPGSAWKPEVRLSPEARTFLGLGEADTDALQPPDDATEPFELEILRPMALPSAPPRPKGK